MHKNGGNSMKPTVLYYAKCTTCQKALKWLEERGIAYEGRPIKEENPTADELRDWYEKSGLTAQAVLQHQRPALQRDVAER